MAETALQGMTDFEKSLIHAAFFKHVNLAPREIDKLVGVDPAPAAPAVDGGPVAADPISEPELVTDEQRVGRDLVRIRRAKREELADVDYKRMREAVNYIRKLADRPPKDADEREAWRAGLMARGFDPAKAAEAEEAEAKSGELGGEG